MVLGVLLCCGWGCDLVSLDRSSGGVPSVRIGCNGRECGGSCGTCTAGFACDGEGRCQMQASTWAVTIVGAEVPPRDERDSNSTWDPEGGAPDPRVCFSPTSAPGVRCSAAAQETLSPLWNVAAGTFTPPDLMRGMTITVEDVDDLVNDTIGSCAWTPDRESFRRGTSTLRCPGVNVIVRVSPL